MRKKNLQVYWNLWKLGIEFRHCKEKWIAILFSWKKNFSGRKFYKQDYPWKKHISFRKWLVVCFFFSLDFLKWFSQIHLQGNPSRKITLVFSLFFLRLPRIRKIVKASFVQFVPFKYLQPVSVRFKICSVVLLYSLYSAQHDTKLAQNFYSVCSTQNDTKLAQN